MGAIVTPHRTMKVAILFLTLLPLLCPAAENEFFTMDNGLRDVKTITGKAALLEELGYDAAKRAALRDSGVPGSSEKQRAS